MKNEMKKMMSELGEYFLEIFSNGCLTSILLLGVLIAIMIIFPILVGVLVFLAPFVLIVLILLLFFNDEESQESQEYESEKK